MNYSVDNSGHAHAGAGYANVPQRVPFAELVGPFMYVGEQVVQLGSAAVSMAARVAGAFLRWRNERSTVKALRALEDFRLDDIGIRREDIVAVARKLANG